MGGKMTKYKPIKQSTLKQILRPYKKYFGFSRIQILKFNSDINKARYSYLKEFGK